MGFGYRDFPLEVSGRSAAWLARLPWEQEVGRSNRLAPTNPSRPQSETLLYVINGRPTAGGGYRRDERIRKIYTNFFNQGQEVRYQVQDMKIEIYQNAVEVKARYEIDQILKMGERMVWKGNVHWVLGKENGIFKILSLDYQHQQIY